MSPDIDSIRSKLKSLEHLREKIERIHKETGRLLRHQGWRLNYYQFPYLIGTSSETLETRFRDVFLNVYDVTADGKIVPRPDEDLFLLQKFTHLIEEWNSRGGLPVSVAKSAAAQVRKYFENGEPVGTRFFEKLQKPSAPFLVRYSKKEFLEPLLKRGLLRICPASYYSDPTHIESVRDSETAREIFFPTFRERLRGETSISVQGYQIPLRDSDLSIPVEMQDYFLLSSCSQIYHRLPTDFDATAAIVIRDPKLFSQRVISAFLAAYPEWQPIMGNVTYYDPYNDYNKLARRQQFQMLKHFRYSYQREHRIAFLPRTLPPVPLKPEFINIGPMTDYAEIVAG